MRWNSTMLKDHLGRVVGVPASEKTSPNDYCPRNRAADEQRILEMAARNMPYPKCLTPCAGIWKPSLRTEHAARSWLLDGDGLHVRHGAAPGLPESYVQAIEGSAIGPTAGSCGTAMFRRKQVIVSDIANDSLWRDYVNSPCATGCAPCWSTPIFSDKGNVLGSFAIYYPEPHTPSEAELRMTERATYFAGIVISRRQAEQALRESEERYRNIVETAQEGIW